ncbi:hypothetical protein ACNQKP_17105 [Bdellovibrio bacteriovorus]
MSTVLDFSHVAPAQATAQRDTQICRLNFNPNKEAPPSLGPSLALIHYQ